MSNTLYTNYNGNIFVCGALAVAAHANVAVDVVVVDAAMKASAEHLAANHTGKYPCLKTENGCINESLAIAKYFAHGTALLGADDFEAAKVDEWCLWLQGSTKACYPAYKATFGMSTEVTKEEYTVSMNAVKEIIKTISNGIGEGEWLVGAAPTVADYLCANIMSFAFQTMLDSGFCKAKINAAAANWFKRVAALPAFIAVNGKMMVCEKAIKPVLVAEAKKAAVVKETPEEIAAKKAAKEAAKAEKPKSGLDALPECDFDLYSYKTFLVNEPDRAGVGMAKTKEMFQSEKFNDGYSWWWVKYEKYGNEGQVEFMFANMLGGFMQRIDPKLSRYAFARVLMLGEEPNLDIEGIFMFRGQEIPELMNDNPQFEYFEKKKLDFMGNAEDYAKIGEFWAVGKEGGSVGGRPVKQQE